MRKNVFLILLVFLKGFCLAQNTSLDTIKQLEEVKIASNRLHYFSVGNKVLLIDSNILNQYNSNNLAELIAKETPVLIKSYGLSGLATPSFRGTSAGHTAVLWNGFNISGVSNGILDFSLVPVNFLNQVKVQFGGSGALWGSGSIGGTIHLNNLPDFDKGLSLGLNLNLGSFSNHQENLQFTLSKKKWITSTKFFNHEAKNDFPFINVAQFGKPLQRVLNSEIKQYGFLQENYFKIKENQLLKIRFWHQYTDRNLPASMTVGKSLAYQQDAFYRSTAEWQLTKEKFLIIFRSAYFYETLKYTDPQIQLESDFISKTWISELESKIKLGKNQLLNIGLNHTNNIALTANYHKNAEQNRSAGFASYRIQNTKGTFFANASVRQEIILNGNHPFTASIGFESWFWKNIRLKGNASKNYRLPSLNDLYWTPGGNQFLKPEFGYSEELALAYVKQINGLKLEAEITAFNSSITNWIIWLPDDIGIWTPTNILSVWSRGLEYDLKVSYSFPKIKFELNANYQYLRTTNGKTFWGENPLFGKQLIYVPHDKGQITFTTEYQGFRLALNYNYIGYRFTTSDNTQYLKPFHIGKIDLSKQIKISNYNLRAFIQVNNLWNVNYQLIAFYAMPGRSYQGGIALLFNQQNNKIDKK